MSSKMKSLLGMYAMAAMSVPNMPSYEPTKEEKERRLAKKEKSIKKSNGLKEFSYGENTLLALNQKNADKKAKQKGWL